MKFNSLQFGKAMSAALFVLLLSVVGTKNALALTQVATLQHNDTITGVYYGANAFVSAYNAASSGDVITLSSGTFNPSAIDKTLTIHGAGCVYDSVNHVLPTIISGDVGFYANNTNIEGVYFSGRVLLAYYGNYGNNNSFVKCNINAISNEHGNRMNNSFVNCIIMSFASYYFQGTTIINSVVKFTSYTHNSVSYPTSVYNSVVLFDDALPVNNLYSYNSLIGIDSIQTVSNCNFTNTIGIQTGASSLFEGQPVQNVMTVDNYSDVFENFDGVVSYDNNYQLKEEIATTFLGNDGTEVGIYGGMMPYNPRPSYMIMKRCNVAPRSTIDGKLSVEIEIIAEDE